MNTSTVLDVPEIFHPEWSVKTRAEIDDSKPDWKSTASATAKLLLRGVRDSADAFGPLKSVTGGLCFILENYEVCAYPHVALSPVFTIPPANEGK